MAYNYGSNIGYGSGGSTYAGDGQRQLAQPSPSDFFIRLRRPNVKTVLLATLRFGIPLIKGINDPAVSSTARRFYLVPGFQDVSAVYKNGGASLPKVDLSALPSTPGAYSWDGFNGDSTLYLHPVSGQSADDNIYVAECKIFVSTFPKNFRGFAFEPRITRAPSISLRIEDKFGGVGQLGGGKLTLNNADGRFDFSFVGNVGFVGGQEEVDPWKTQPNFDFGEVTLELGVDDPAGFGEMSIDDYLKLGVWRVEKWKLDEDAVELELKEQKTKFDQQIPFEIYTREEFPSIANDDVGKTIPFAWGKILGAEPVVIDRQRRRFKVASHPIHSFDGVRVKVDVEEIIPTEWLDDLWTLEEGETFISVEDSEIVNVSFLADDSNFDGDLEEVNSIEEVKKTAGSWTQKEGILYVTLPAGYTAITEGTVTVSLRNEIPVWKSVSFESIDLVNAEFTLAIEDWDRSSEVSVDFSGRKMPNGELMTNGAEIMADLIDYVGEINLSDEMFSAARRALHIGFDRFGREVNHLAPSLYLDEPNSALQVASELNALIGGFLYVGVDGQWRFEIFTPKQGYTTRRLAGQPLRYFDETTIIDGSFSRTVQTKDCFSRALVHYAPRLIEEWSQSLERERLLNRFGHNLSSNVVEEREAGFVLKSDADYFAQRLLTTEGIENVIYKFKVPWTAFFTMPGDFVRVVYERFSLNQILEVLRVKYDLMGSVEIEAGNARGWSDSFGFWLADTGQVVPAIPEDTRLWYDAGSLPKIDGQLIQAWPDSSGNNQPLTMPFVGNRPRLFIDKINGFPAVGFGLQHFMYWPNLAALLEGEIFSVLRVELDPATGVTPGFNGTLGNSLWDVGTNAEGTNFPYTDGNIYESFGSTLQHNLGDPTVALTDWRLYNVISTPSEFTANLDNTPLFTTPTNTVGFPTDGRLGRWRNNSGFLFGYIAEMIIFDRKLSTTERQSVVQYLSDKYNLGLVTAGGPPPAWPSFWTWTNEEAIEARQNAGFWTDESERASLMDPRSHWPGRWW